MRFALIKNGRVVTVVESATTPQQNALFDTAEEYGPQHEPAPEAPDYGTKLSKFAFRMRFAATEREDLEMQAADDPAAAAGPRRIRARLRSFLADIAVAPSIDLSSTHIRQSLQAIETLGILGAGRANEIISAPVQSHERP